MPTPQICLNTPAGGEIVIGDRKKLGLILGPCVIESRDLILRHTDKIKSIVQAVSGEDDCFSLIFKSSFDKANRTSKGSFRGIGIDESLKILSEVRTEFDLPVITDIHSPEQVPVVGAVCDILQIPAFLCRQTDLLIAAGESKKPILIKKGQFLHPDDMKYAADKIVEGGSDQILLCERGVSFGYRDLVVDFKSFSMMNNLGYPVVFDVTHSVQSLGGAGGKTSGASQYVPQLARAGVAFGVDALFMEAHEEPSKAPSDGPNMIKLENLESVLESIKAVWLVSREFSRV
jgi:2-dehydro-3-deoxyphosphooctonate aldolase (KDO 8-P synthase)